MFIFINSPPPPLSAMSARRRVRAFSPLGLGVLLGLLVAAAPAAAQQLLTGRLAGSVSESEGPALPGVTVTIESPNLMGTRTAFTLEDGSFGFPSLPPGVYTITTELDGFIPQKRTEVEVRLNRTTEIHVALEVGEFTDEIVVVADTPVVDPEQSSLSQTYTVEFLKKASVGLGNRSYQAVLGQSGGVTGGANPNVFGSTGGENAYLIDGIDSTDPVTATFGTNQSFDTLEQINFEKSGADVTYGRATGGVVNVRTKSGGNDFSGSIDSRYRDSSFNESGEHFDPDRAPFSWNEQSVTFGGPIQRDKLWFFTSVNPVLTKFTPTAANTTREFDGLNTMGKLTWQTTEQWQVMGRYLNEAAEIDFDNASRFITPEFGALKEQPNVISSVEALGVPNSNLSLKLFGSLYRSELNIFPRGGDLDKIGHWDPVTQLNTVNYFNQQFSNRDRDDFNASVTWFTKGVGSDHELAAGVERTANSFRTRNDWTGKGYFYFDNDRRPWDLRYQPLTSFVDFEGLLTSVYVQDTWRPKDNVTVKLGLRHDDVSYDNDVGTTVAELSKLQPRVGVAWDIQGDSKMIARANWSRRMHPGALTLPENGRLSSVPTLWYWSCTNRNPNNSPETCQQDNAGSERIGDRSIPRWIPDPEGAWDPNGWFLQPLWTSTTEPDRIVDDLDPTYIDEWSLGLEREIARRTSVTLSYIEKETFDIIENTCNGNWPTPRADSPCNHFVMANLDGLTRDYSGFILDFETRYWDGMQIIGSYTYSQSKGNIGYTQGSGSDFNFYPVHFENRYGYMGDDRRHRVKVNGYVDLPLGFTVGFDGFWSSAGAYTPLRRIPNRFGGVAFDEPRGSRRGNDRFQLDLQATKAFRLGGNLSLELIGVVNNVLGDEQTIGICTFVDGCFRGSVAFDGPTSYQQPRRYEAGIRFEF